MIFDCENEPTTRNAKLIRRETDRSNGDIAADEAFDGVGTTFDFYNVGDQSNAPGSPHPDEMGYVLSIAADDGTHELAGTDAGASTEFARLVKQVKRRGKAEAV